MKFKRFVNYKLDYEQPWLDVSAFFAGVAFLCIVLRYYVFTGFEKPTGGEFVFHVVLPLFLLGVYMVSLRAFRLKAPEFFAVLSCLYCLMSVVWSFDTGNVLLIVFAFVWQVLAGAILMVTVAGYLNVRWYSVGAFAVPVLFKLFSVNWGSYLNPLDLKGLLPDLTVLGCMLCFVFFCVGLKEVPLRTPGRVQKEKEA